MKLFKGILYTITNIILIPVLLLLTFGILWYTLPNIGYTKLGLFILKYINNNIIFWVTIILLGTTLILFILQKLFGRQIKAKYKNFYIHLITWLICLLSIGLSIYTFVTINPLISNQLEINIPRKISIGVIIGILTIYHIFSNKISKIVNRRIQAYETAKESNIIGRSSVVFTNILKLLELFFPEFIMLSLLSFCVSWNIASYFIIILIVTLIPMIGNIICDFNIRNEIKIKNELERDLLVQKISNNIKGVK